MVLTGKTGTGIQHKDHHIGFGDCLLRLLGHLLEDAARCVRLETTGIDDDVLMLALTTLAVMAVTRQPCKVSDDGISRLGESIEQRRLAHIGAPYQGNNWLHSKNNLSIRLEAIHRAATTDDHQSIGSDNRRRGDSRLVSFQTGQCRAIFTREHVHCPKIISQHH